MLTVILPDYHDGRVRIVARTTSSGLSSFHEIRRLIHAAAVKRHQHLHLAQKSRRKSMKMQLRWANLQMLTMLIRNMTPMMVMCHRQSRAKPLIVRINADSMSHGGLVASVANGNSRRHQSTLVVAPMSLLSQWRDELIRTADTDDLSVLVYYGGTRTDLRADLESWNRSGGDQLWHPPKRVQKLGWRRRPQVQRIYRRIGGSSAVRP